MSSFFTLPSEKKRKRSNPTDQSSSRKRIAKPASSTKESTKPRRPQRDESISGSDDDDSDDGPRRPTVDQDDDLSSEEDEAETAAEKRLRLAERYLENIRDEVATNAENEVGFDAEQIDRDLIAERLREDVAESKGRMYRALASELDFEHADHSWARWNEQTITGVAVCAPYAYTVGKGLELCKWRIQDLPADQWPDRSEKRRRKKKKIQKAKPPPKKKPEQILFTRGDKKKAKDFETFQGHVDTILCVAASQDGKFVATGGKDRRIVIWDANTLKCLKVFSQHRDAVTALAFRRGTNQMYSASKDRTVKVWSLDELAYVETLFGHQDEVVDIAALAQERCISVGARDRTARLWKVVEETQLVFRGGGSSSSKKSSSKSNPPVLEGSMDRIAMIDEELFVTGGDNGALALWSINKKKPVFTLPMAHGREPAPTDEERFEGPNPEPTLVVRDQPRWITALKTVPYSDVVLSGSWDGQIRAWKVSSDKKKLEQVGSIGSSEHGGQPLIRGIVNDISIYERGERAKNGLSVVVAVGKEHRLGRWKREKGKNGLVVLEVAKKEVVTNGTTNGVHDEGEDED